MIASDWPPSNAGLDEIRHSLEGEGAFLAYRASLGVSVVSCRQEWTRIGRSLASDLRLDDPSVSPRHALIVRQPDGYRALDDRSKTGLFVNGEQVEWTTLVDGDVITVGRFALVFLWPAQLEHDVDSEDEWPSHIGPVWTQEELLERFAPEPWEGHGGVSTVTATREDINSLQETLIALPDAGGEYVFPDFQFDGTGKPYGAVLRIVPMFRREGVDEWTTASWFCSTQSVLEDLTPAAWLHRRGEEHKVLEAARRSLARLSR
jgi:pSer/pThr/pTyr-binding forkhead associated (FHA) protein